MKKVFFVLLLGVSMILSSCGGGGGVSTTMDVTMTDFMFQPAQFTVPAGQEITVNAVNNGAVAHNIVVMKFGQTVGDMFDDADLPNIYWEMELDPGDSGSATFIAPGEPGEYQVICRIPGHLAAGMSAKLIVVGE